jgi:hypothetical protein
MYALRPSDMNIAIERLPFDDETLIGMHDTLQSQILEKEEQFANTRVSKNNYLHYTISRLAYSFAREEYESVLFEMRMRGLGNC